MLTLGLTRIALGSGTIEEQATFGTFALRANGRCLTEGVAADGNELLPGPRAAGYYVAEWLAWNWWRLLWEAGSANPGREWTFAHCLSSIGAGYVWPNIEISSDGVFASIASTRTTDSAPGLYRYVGASRAEVVSAENLQPRSAVSCKSCSISWARPAWPQPTCTASGTIWRQPDRTPTPHACVGSRRAWDATRMKRTPRLSARPWTRRTIWAATRSTSWLPTPAHAKARQCRHAKN